MIIVAFSNYNVCNGIDSDTDGNCEDGEESNNINYNYVADIGDIGTIGNL